MKLYKEFYLGNNTFSYIRLNHWIRANHSKYNYKVVGYQSLAWDCSLILIAYWPKTFIQKLISSIKNIFKTTKPTKKSKKNK